jgi:hypothetical protein
MISSEHNQESPGSGLGGLLPKSQFDAERMNNRNDKTIKSASWKDNLPMFAQ